MVWCRAARSRAWESWRAAWAVRRAVISEEELELEGVGREVCVGGGVGSGEGWDCCVWDWDWDWVW